MEEKKQNTEYLFGANDYELKRLEFQQEVWKDVTGSFFDKINIRKGWKCLDAGCGPGFTSIEIRNRIGDEGSLTSLEPSGFYIDWFKDYAGNKGWTNIEFINSFVENAELQENYYDFIFARWVITFAKDPENFISRLVKALKPGGIIAFQDYNYEGLSLFPKGGAFDKVPEKVKAYYKSEGGDPYVASKIPAIFKKENVELKIFHPNCLAGGPESGVYEWAHRFFNTHIQLMADRDIIPQEEADAMLADWLAHRENPDAIFFSPIVVDVAGVKR